MRRRHRVHDRLLRRSRRRLRAHAESRPVQRWAVLQRRRKVRSGRGVSAGAAAALRATRLRRGQRPVPRPGRRQHAPAGAGEGFGLSRRAGRSPIRDPKRETSDTRRSLSLCRLYSACYTRFCHRFCVFELSRSIGSATDIQDSIRASGPSGRVDELGNTGGWR